MNNFISFDERSFYKAIQEKKYSRLKTYIINSIRNNPGFLPMERERKDESSLVMEILKRDVGEMFESYKEQEGEHAYRKNESEVWDKEYFIRQTFYLGENFCQERFDHIREIGKKITVVPSSNFQKTQERCGKEQNRNQSQQFVSKRSNPCLVVGSIILAIIVLVTMYMEMK